jgi:hypothetical protein
MAGSTLTTYAALLKERYLDSDIVEKLVYPENTLLSMLEKKGDKGMVGDTLPVPVFVGNPQGVSAGFSTAQTNATATKSVAWQITAGDYFGVVHIGDKVLEASRTNQGAFLENKRVEIDGLYETAGDSASIYLWGNGGQALGRVAAINTNDFVLTEASQAANFEVGMEVVFSADDGSVSTHALRTGNTTIDAINRATGVVTGTAADITGEAVGDYMFRQGDFFGDTGTIVIKGVQCFVTATDSPMELWGVAAATRALDPQRYAGCRVDATQLLGKTYEERIKILLAQMTGRFKAKAPTAGFMHPEDFQVLETLMSARGVRALEDSNTKFGFMKIDVATASGRIPIYTDRHCPKGTFFALRMEDWGLSSMGELFHPQRGDGLDILRRATSTDYEFRLLSYPLLWCRAPKNNGRVGLQ